MKILRSTKCSLQYATAAKRAVLSHVLTEYATVVNHFIIRFWADGCPAKAALLKPIVDSPQTWLSFRLRKVAAREAIDMVIAARKRWAEKAVVPVHRGTRVCANANIARLTNAAPDSAFDAWLVLTCLGEHIRLDLPVQFHRQYHKLAARGKRLESYIITAHDVQFSFEIETGPKREPQRCIGVDTGINALATLSTGEKLGTDIKAAIERIKRCQHGSQGQRRASRALRQRMDEVARDVVAQADLIVVERLTGITHGTKVKRRLTKNMRRTLGRWCVRHWLRRLQQRTEWNCVSFRSVVARHTSQMCRLCGHVERGNRRGLEFRCLRCGHTDDADVNASLNILARFTTGAYGPGCKVIKQHNGPGSECERDGV